MKEVLDDLRQGIDYIDDKLIALLQERAVLVREVGKRKNASGGGGSFIRPGREATMLRDLTDKIGDSFPKAAIASIWRTIIAGSLSIEQSMRIVAYQTKTDNLCYWLAREYFGAFLPMSQHNDIKQNGHDVMAGHAAVGVIPSPLSTPENQCWWLSDGKILDKNPRIFACVPFVITKEPDERVFAIANVSPEPTDDDTSILAITVDDACSQGHIADACSHAKIVTRNIQLIPNAVAEGKRHFLVEAHGFMTENSVKILEIRDDLKESLDEMAILGSYANPIIIEPTEEGS